MWEKLECINAETLGHIWKKVLPHNTVKNSGTMHYTAVYISLNILCYFAHVIDMDVHLLKIQNP